MTRTGFPPRIRPWLISSAATLAVLGAVELGFRIAGVPAVGPPEIITELDPARLVRNRAGLSIRTFDRQVPVTTNRFGFRGRETTVEKPAGVYRIVALGDSCTFGASVGDDDTFCAQLEGLLNAGPRTGPRRFEVINAGVIGYVSMQGLRTLRDILPFRPDCLVVSFALNDSDPGGSLRDFLGNRRPDIERIAPPVVLVRNLLWNHSFACRWFLRDGLRRVWDSRLVRKHVEAGRAGWKPESSDDYRHDLAEFVRIARENGMDIVFLPLPVRLKHTMYPQYGDGEPAGTRQACRASLRRVEHAIGQTTDRAKLSAMHLFAARLHETLGETRPALDAYLKAMELSDRSIDLRWGGYEYANLMAAVAAKEKAPLANILPEFYRRELSDNPPDLYADAYHPGPLGHRIIAAALGEVVRDLARRRGGR